ncbi:MAG TPA: phenylalanine 4-monooxygenase [Rhodospirillaceae bacterium]|nr:phenylalanine 4-monooxygenase [Rhodospirillaceae bacterium]
MTNNIPEDRGLASAKHYNPGDGWTRGDLDFFIVPQHVYTEEENDVWRILFKRQQEILKGRAIDLFMDSMSTLGIDAERVPSFDEVNAILMKRTGWQVVPVEGLIPDEPFFELLANRRFPAGNFIRTRDSLDYIQEPDVFHDVFGHVPLLADPTFAKYMEEYGKGGLKAAGMGMTHKIARLYWYTVEFGLIRQKDGLRIYGAGILSSPTESVFALESASPHRIGFDVKRLLQTHYQIDDFQDNYFVIDSFEALLGACYQDFGNVYAEVKGQPDYEAHDIAETDRILTRGTHAYFEAGGRKG